MCPFSKIAKNENHSSLPPSTHLKYTFNPNNNDAVSQL